MAEGNTLTESASTPLKEVNLPEITSEISGFVKYTVFPDYRTEEFKERLIFLNSNSFLLTDALNSPNPQNFESTVTALGKFLRYRDDLSKSDRYLIKEKGLEEDLNRFTSFGVSLLTNNLEKIEKYMEGDIALESKSDMMSAIVYLGRVGAGIARKKAIGILVRHFEGGFREGYLGRSNFRGDSPIADTILTYGTQSQVEDGKQKIINLLHDPDPNTQKLVCNNIPLSRSFDYEEDSRVKAIEDIISSFGVDGRKMFEGWRFARMHEGALPEFSLPDNLISLLELEKERPGIVKVLQSEFGINDFARYHKELLIAQYDEREAKDSLPYGVIIYPQSDHNGSFYNNKKAHEKLLNELLGKYRIRVFEVESVLGLVSALNSARHKFGKISFAIIGGHGERNLIHFGGSPSMLYKSKKGEELKQEDVARSGASSVALAFENNPTIILQSCSTGQLGGIGQDISKIGATVIAPPKPTSIEDIDTEILPDGRIEFKVKYYSKDLAPNVYQEGNPSLA